MSKIMLNLKNLSEAATIVVAVSTGVDSMVLLSLLEETKNNIVVAHVNHQKREQSSEEESFIKDYCKKHNIPCEVLRLTEVEGNFQNEAREQRYAFFKAVADQYNTKYIATAHHLDDTVENVYLRLTKGSYFKSLTGINNVNLGDYIIIRPLLNETKDSIVTFAENNNIRYYEDNSNKENNYKRNRMRNKIIPLLEKENPSLDKAIHNFTSELSEVNELFESLVECVFSNGQINLDKFVSLHISLRRYALYKLLGSLATRGLVNEILLSIDKNIDNKCFVLATHTLFIEYKKLFITANNNEVIDHLVIDNYGNYVFYNYHIRISKNDIKNEDNLCYNKKELLKLYVTTPVDGLKLTPTSKTTVKRLLVELKVPKALRATLPVIVDNEGNVLMVGNYWKNKLDINYSIELTEEN